ncbi:MAG: LytTR family transcriptional regulator DNA-binding domain-containing protein [Lachnospiraceae bacterium]|nr:LytTR family transcriptional regulator DNA-binding domain-containing protein [Lachnospiraceae bacterium]
MKLIKTKDEQLKENYLELHYRSIDEETKAVLARLTSQLQYVDGVSEEKHEAVALTDVFYFESVDHKTFAYTADHCVEMREALRDLAEAYENAGFVRISKSVIVNLYQIKKLQGDLNMRVKLYMKNGEVLVMNRSYRAEFYQKLNKLGRRGQ